MESEPSGSDDWVPDGEESDESVDLSRNDLADKASDDKRRGEILKTKVDVGLTRKKSIEEDDGGGEKDEGKRAKR